MVILSLASLPGLLPYLLSVRFRQRVSKPTHISILIVSAAKLQHPASVCKQTQLDIHSTKKMILIVFCSRILCSALVLNVPPHPRTDEWKWEISWLRSQKAIVFPELSKHSALHPRRWRAGASAVISKEMCVHKIYNGAHQSGTFCS